MDASNGREALSATLDALRMALEQLDAQCLFAAAAHLSRVIDIVEMAVDVIP